MMALGEEERQIVIALIQQVAKAAAGRSERDVRTIITRPLWRRFCIAMGGSGDEQPTPWTSVSGECWRVYGSETVVVDSPHEFSASTFHPSPR